MRRGMRYQYLVPNLPEVITMRAYFSSQKSFISNGPGGPDFGTAFPVSEENILKQKQKIKIKKRSLKRGKKEKKKKLIRK